MSGCTGCARGQTHTRARTASTRDDGWARLLPPSAADEMHAPCQWLWSGKCAARARPCGRRVCCEYLARGMAPAAPAGAATAAPTWAAAVWGPSGCLLPPGVSWLVAALRHSGLPSLMRGFLGDDRARKSAGRTRGAVVGSFDALPGMACGRAPSVVRPCVCRPRFRPGAHPPPAPRAQQSSRTSVTRSPNGYGHARCMRTLASFHSRGSTPPVGHVGRH